MLVLFAVRPVGRQFRRVLQVDRESITTDAGVERLILEVEREAVMLVVGLIATLVPAGRSLRIPAVEALRADA